MSCSEPCGCGAEDCPRCNPSGWAEAVLQGERERAENADPFRDINADVEAEEFGGQDERA